MQKGEFLTHAYNGGLLRPRFAQRDTSPPLLRDLDQLDLFTGTVLADVHRRSPTPVEQLRTWIERTGLSLRDFSLWVLGRDVSTLQSYLRGARIPHAQWCWISRLEWVELRGDQVVIAIRAGQLKNWREWRRRRARIRRWEEELRRAAVRQASG